MFGALYDETIERERARAVAYKRRAGSASGTAAADWRAFTRVFFGSDPVFAPRHERAWAWFAQLRPDTPRDPLIECWGRGGGKSSTIEGGVAWLGTERDLRRRFVLYVSRTQAQANVHVQAVGTALERAGIGRAVNTYNQSKGWTQSLLRTAGGYTVLAFGLDAALRGIKIDLFRPDLIVLDDIDDKNDTVDATDKKIVTITETVLPTGAPHAAIIFVQNKIVPDGVMAQLLDGRADFLHDRPPIVVEPAVTGLSYEQQARADGRMRYVITGGAATWAVQNLTTCERQINQWGLAAFLREAQHEDQPLSGDLFAHLVFRHCLPSAVPDLEQVIGWCDPAVTATDNSDAHGIQFDGRASDGTIYRLWSWEQRATPLHTITLALRKAVQLAASVVGIETNQGGDTWLSVIEQAWAALQADPAVPEITAATRRPRIEQSKATAATGGKRQRAQEQLADYEGGRIVHVIGTHDTLERALIRFPRQKPFDLVDAAYWSWRRLRVPPVVVQPRSSVQSWGS